MSQPRIGSEDLQSRYHSVISVFEEIALLSMAESMELDTFLQTIGRRLIELLEISRCTVYLRRDDGRFSCHAGWSAQGDMGEQVTRLVTGPDRLTQQVVRSARPVLVEDARNHPLPDKEAMAFFDVRDILAVPLVLEGEVIGVIYVDNEDEEHDYTPEDLATAQAFASLAAIAVRQIELRRQLARHNAVIAHKNQQLEKIGEITQLLSDATLKGAEIGDLLTMVQGFLHRPVLLYSADLKLLHWTAPRSQRLTRPPALPEGAWKLEEVRRIRSAGNTGVVLLPPLPAVGSPHRRLVSPIVVERRKVGYIEAVEFGRPFVSLEGEILGQAAIAIALQLLTDRRRTEDEDQARSDFVGDLLNGQREPGALRRRATAHGLDPEGTYRLLRTCYAWTDDADGREHTGKARRGVSERLLREGLPGVSGLVGTSVPGSDIFLVDEPESSYDLEKGLAALQPALESAGARFMLLSAPISGLESLPTNARELREMETALWELDATPRFMPMRKVGVLTMLLRDAGVGRASAFASEVLAPLQRVDNGDVLMETTRAFLEANCHVREASRRLKVHENTVRYRINRAGDAMGLDLTDLSGASQVRLALQIHDLRST